MRLELRGAIEGVQDVARIAGRMALGRATPRDLVALGRSAGLGPRIAACLGDAPAFAGARAALQDAGGALAPVAQAVAQRCVEAPPAHLREGGLFRDGADALLDASARRSPRSRSATTASSASTSR
jgi:DNA mismatch repair protein MutS